MKKILSILSLLLCQIAAHAQIGLGGYDPSNPPGPGEDGDTVKYVTLHLYSDPANGGTFSWGIGSQGEYYYNVEPGKQYTATSYPSTGFDFSHWTIDDVVVGRARSYTFTAPDHDFSLVCHYTYNPENPANPSKNFWNSDTGDLIITDFKPGHLYDALVEEVGQINLSTAWQLLKSVTVAGTCGSVDVYDYPNSDWEAFYFAENLIVIDMSRTVGLDHVPAHAFDYENQLVAIHLPATTQRIEERAFSGCSHLQRLVCHATTPPILAKDVFKGAGDFTVSVPAESMGLYASADGWKDLALTPIVDQVSKLTASLPQTADLDTFRDMFLELINLQTGQTKRMVITDRFDYTFTNLLHNTAYNAYLRTQNGGIVGRVDSIPIIDHDVKVTFSSLKNPVNVTLTLIAPDGQDVTTQAAVTWTDTRGNYLCRDNELTGRVESDSVCYSVKLSESLGMLYLQPQDSTYYVKKRNNIRLYLQPIPQTTISGTVVSESTGHPVRGASVSAVQLLNGLYPSTLTTQTDANGHYTLTLYEAPTELTAFSSSYLKQSRSYMVHAGSSGESQDFALKDITGTTISIDLYYRPALADGEENLTADDHFDNQSDVSYTIYDETHQRDITTMSVQFPLLVLTDDELEPGTQLRITGSSKSGSFMPVTNTCRVDSAGHSTITLGITQLGILNASFEMTDNKSVVGIVYDAEGRLVGYAPYSEARLTVDGLADGDYTLVTMGYNSLFSTLGTLLALDEMGIVDGRNCVMNAFRAESGRIKEVSNDVIPFFDETGRLYTTEDSYFRANKDVATVGTYVTLRAQAVFKQAYADLVTDVKIAVDLPENCTLVEGSVMAGSDMADYYMEGQRLWIILPHADDAVRFCVVPISAGIIQPAAYVRFSIGENRSTQPIGSTTITAEEMTIEVRETTAIARIPVSGAAPSNSLVEIYDGETLIGQTTTLLSGSWSLWVDLVRAYNMSEHYVYARITTPEGVSMQTETVIVTVDRKDLLPVVDMSFWNNLHYLTEHVVWDFRTQTVNKTVYGWPLDHSSLPVTFQIDFMANDQTVNDTTQVSDVMLGIELDNGVLLEVPAYFNKLKNCWMVERDIDTEALPSNVWVEWYASGSEAIDRAQLDDMTADIELGYNEGRQIYLDAKEDFNIDGVDVDNPEDYEELSALLDIKEPDEDQLQRRDSLMRVIVGDDLMDEAMQMYAVDYTEIDDILARNRENPDAEEVLQATARLIEISNSITAEETDLESEIASLQAELAELMADEPELQAMASQMYDNTVDGLSLFFAGYEEDFQMPEGDIEFVVPGDSLDRYYVQKTLASIDRDQLLEEGYQEYETTDGYQIYVLQEGYHYCIIDTKSMLLRSMEQKPGTGAAPSRMNGKLIHDNGVGSAKAFISKQCIHLFTAGVDKLVKTAMLLKDAVGTWEKFKTILSVAYENLQEVNTGLECMYGEGMASLRREIEDRFGDRAKAEAESKKNEQLNRIEKKKQQLAEKEARLKRLQQNYPRLKESEKILQECLRTSQNPGMTARLEADLNSVRQAIAKVDKAADELGSLTKATNYFIRNCQKEINAIDRLLKGLFKHKGAIVALLDRIPQSIAAIKAAGRTAIQGSGFLGKVFGTVIGAFFQIAPLVILIDDNTKDAKVWDDLVKEVEGYYPCDGDEAKWESLFWEVKWDNMWHTGIDYTQIGADAASLIIDVFDLPLTPHWLVSLVIDIASITTAFVHPNCSKNDQQKIRNGIESLDCQKKPEDPVDDWENPTNTLWGMNKQIHGVDKLKRSVRRMNRMKSTPGRDPSGFVYEAVASNRLEGVTATCYYKEEVEDMYGDLHENIVVWDAENYAQQNPLFTDSEGKYAWDVPRGLWQVRFEKDGYETAHSEWLPVPPPQLDVNVGMTQLRQPMVAKVRACTDGIDVEFDKYMRPQTLVPSLSDGAVDAINVARNGQAVEGTITLLNEESAPAGSAAAETTYASRLRFVPATPLSPADKVVLTVRRTVESYAGLQMEADFQQQFDVMERIQQLVADSLVAIAQGDERTLTVQALPVEVARGKQLTVVAQPADVLAIAGSLGMSEQVLTFDQNGKATVTVRATSVGSGAVRFQMPDDELETSTEVIVRDEASMQVLSPQSSRLSGTTLYIGSEIRLATKTAGATILYTLDGSCPCDPQGGKVLTYAGPIIMTGESMTIKAMAVANGMADSQVVEFNYKGRERPVGIESPTTDGIGTSTGTPTLYFRLDGRRIDRPDRGLNIERHADGTVRKVMLR